MENVLNELKGVSWSTLCCDGLLVGGALQLSSSQRERIEREYTIEDLRKKAGVQCWIWNHPYASWRNLITGLDWEKEHAVAQKLYQYAEKLTGMLMQLHFICYMHAVCDLDLLCLHASLKSACKSLHACMCIIIYMSLCIQPF